MKNWIKKLIIIGGVLGSFLWGGYEYKKKKDLEEYVESWARVIQSYNDYKKGKIKKRPLPSMVFMENKPGIDCWNPERAREQMEERGYAALMIKQNENLCSILGKIKGNEEFEEKGREYRLIQYEEVASSCKPQVAFFYPPERVYINLSLVEAEAGLLWDKVWKNIKKPLANFEEKMAFRGLHSLLLKGAEKRRKKYNEISFEEYLEEFKAMRVRYLKAHELAHAVEGADEVGAILAGISKVPHEYLIYDLEKLSRWEKGISVAQEIFKEFEKKGYSKKKIEDDDDNFLENLGKVAEEIYLERENYRRKHSFLR